MKTFFIGLSVLFTGPVFGQTTNQPRIFNDTSLYFIKQFYDGMPVELSVDDLALAEQLLSQAFEEFNLAEQRYADSVNPKKKKRKAQAMKLDPDNYVFKLIPKKNESNEMAIWILGNSKDRVRSRNGKDTDKNWKQRFIDPQLVCDGGAGYTRVLIHLTNKSHGRLAINGEG